jgi:PD-(D/E)XK nuclease superfamily
MRACACGEAGPQLLLYNEVAQPLADGRPLRLQFAVISKTQTPGFTLHPVVNHAEQVNRIRRIVQRVWIAIPTKHFDLTPSSINCPTCPCRVACMAWQG